jgi:tetratricopeptide (TPR) repeat protein
VRWGIWSGWRPTTGRRARYEAALALYEAIPARLGQANTHSGLAQLALLEGDQAEGDRLLRLAVAQFEEIGDRYSVPAQIGNCGWELLRARRPSEALPYLLRAAELFDAMGLAEYAERHRSAAASIATARDPAAVQGMVEAAIQQARQDGDLPALAQGLGALRELCSRLDDLPGAASAAEERIALGAGDADDWYLVSLSRSREGNHDAAAEASRQVVGLAPTDARARRGYAEDLIRIGRLDEATEQLDAAEALDAAAPYLALRRAELAKARGNRAEALRWAQEALRRQPDWDTAQALLAWGEAGGDPPPP